MTDSVDTATVEQGQEQQPSIQELAAFAFNKPTPQQEVSAINGQQPAAIEAPATTEAAATTEAPAAATQAPDFNAYLKEHFGVDNIETAKSEWQSLQELKNKPATAVEIAFANEESKKIHELIKQGKTKEVGQWIQAQELLSNVETMGDEQKLKLYIKMQNPRFDNELIEDEFNSLYKLNQDDLDALEPLAARKERLKLEQRLENDVIKAQEYFQQYKSKIELPDIQPQQLTVDQDYEAYKASNASAAESYEKVIAPAIKSLKESDVPLSFSVNDANNKMQFDISIVPDAADFESARQDSLTLDVMKTCYDKDGKFMPQNLQKLILLRDNFDKYGQAIARQAVNAERKRVIEQETAGSGAQRNFNTQVEPSEIDALKQFAFQKTG